MIQREDCFPILALPDNNLDAIRAAEQSQGLNLSGSGHPGPRVADHADMPDLRPFLVLGLALGGVFALSGVGLVVLFRATGVLNLAYGAVGATGALIAWSLINSLHTPEWVAYVFTIVFGGVVTLLYGMLFGPPLAHRDPLVKAVATLGLTLILLGIMSWAWSYQAHSLVLPTTRFAFTTAGVRVNATQLIGLGLGVAVTVAPHCSCTSQARHRHARAGEPSRDHGDARRAGAPRRGGGLAGLRPAGGGDAGLLLSTLVGLDVGRSPSS